jgi:WD40 repeat protein
MAAAGAAAPLPETSLSALAKLTERKKRGCHSIVLPLIHGSAINGAKFFHDDTFGSSDNTSTSLRLATCSKGEVCLWTVFDGNGSGNFDEDDDDDEGGGGRQSDGGALVWQLGNLHDGRELNCLWPVQSPFSAHGDGEWLILTGSDEGLVGAIRCGGEDAGGNAGGEMLGTVQSGTAGDVQGIVALPPTGAGGGEHVRVLTAARDDKARAFELAVVNKGAVSMNNELHASHRNSVYAIWPLPDGEHAVSGGAGSHVLVWNIVTGAVVVEHTFSPGGTVRAVGAATTSTGSTMLVICGDADRVECVLFDEGVIRQRPASSSTITIDDARYSAVRSVSLLRDQSTGQLLGVFPVSSGVVIFNLETQEEVYRFECRNPRVCTVGVEADGRLVVATARSDHRVECFWLPGAQAMVKAARKVS